MKYTVVVAEDEELLLNNLVQKIQKADPDFQVTGTAQTGEQAFALVEKLTPDLVITDIRMPVMDGYEATKAIRSSGRADAETVPIYAMTANAFAEDVSAALNAGMDGHIAKPIESKVLYKTLETAFNKKKKSSE